MSKSNKKDNKFPHCMGYVLSKKYHENDKTVDKTSNNTNNEINDKEQTNKGKVINLIDKTKS